MGRAGACARAPCGSNRPASGLGARPRRRPGRLTAGGRGQEWEANSKERRALLAQALRTEREADARVAAGEEERVSLSTRELDLSGAGNNDSNGPASEEDEDDAWLAIPLCEPGVAPQAPAAEAVQMLSGSAPPEASDVAEPAAAAV